MSFRNFVETLILNGYTDEQIAKAAASVKAGYIVTEERVAEMREEMDISARGLAYESDQ